ncbi:elongation factor EF-2 [Halobacteriales archaeon QH_10_65_19]|nr:MAG: elongation factor EF-2 [Halobacteriales archaeon QH_10_65_19]
MDKPENIRNIAIAAHVDHGKCVSGDARISLADGRVVEAERLFEEIRADGEPVADEQEGYRPAETVEVTSYDRTRGETGPASVDYACRRRADEPLVRIRTSSGHELETTPEHRYLVLTRSGVTEFERADNLKEGDTVVGVRQTPAGAGENAKADLLRHLTREYGFYITVTDEFNDRLDAHDRERLYEAANSELKQNSFDHAVWRGQYRLRDIVNVCDELGIDLEELYANVQSLNYRGSDQRGEHSSLELTLPETLEPLFYLAGAYFGDGDCEGNLTNNASEMKAAVREHAARLGMEPIVQEFESRGDRIELGGKTLTTLLQAAFEYPEAEKSSSIRVPEFVFRAGREETAAFIRGYLDADGTVEKNRSAVSVTSTSLGMLEDLQLLLYQFDVASKLNRENNTLYLSGKLSLEAFREIGFTLSDKQASFERLLDTAATAKVDRVPVSGETLRRIRTDLDASQTDISGSYHSYENDDIGLSKLSLSRIVDRFDELDSSDDIRIERLEGLAKADSSFVEVESIERTDREFVYDFGVETHQNFVCEGIVVHNTTLTDNLLAGAGMISDETAGEQLAMDTEEDEQERGITIDAANVSMTHEYEGTNHLINLIDTPGHVDFGGDVTRAMRAVDGAMVVVDAVEGAMPQTETVLRQALREGVKPTLFINKVDRLISELQEGPQEMQERMTTVIRDVNDLIRGMTEEMEDIDEDWTVSVEEGTVGFGSALYKWGVSFPSMRRTGMDFGDIIELEQNDKRQELAEKTPLADVVLDMVCEHFPNPLDAQPRRIPRIWRGDADSEVAETMQLVDPDGEVVFMVTDISMDPHAGEIATGRVFSGTLEKGQELHVSGTVGTNRLQSVGIFMGGEREEVEKVPAGNVAAVTGLADAIAGSTVSSVEMTPFESIEHISEPVITKSVEAQNMDDLPKLIETLQQVAKEDPTIEIEINEDTGEHLMSGQGELHLEVVSHRIERDQGIPVQTGEPIVVFREAPQESSREVEGISPNRHNRFYMSVEPLDNDVVEALTRGKATMDMPELERREALQEAGLDKDTSQEVEDIHSTNIIVDETKGIQHLNETMELVIEGMEEALDDGPLANEPVQGSLVRLHDARLHEDAIHRGPAQVIPAVRNSLHNALIDAEIRLLEPIQQVRIDVPNDHMGAASGEIQGRRGRVDDMYQEGDLMVVEGVAPVEEMIGFSSDIRSATEGRASWNTENAGFQVMADNLQHEKIMEIRERKGMKLELSPAVDYF